MKETNAATRTLDLFGWPHHYQGSTMPDQPTPPQIPNVPATTRIILEVYSAHFASAYGRPPVLTAKTRAIAKSMATTLDAESARLAIGNAFADSWFVNTAGGELTAIYGQLNKWLNTQPGKVATRATAQTTTRRTGLPDY